MIEENNSVELIKNFEFDGLSLPMKPLKTYSQSARFADACIPIIMSHVRPIEQVLAAWVNGRAPMDYTWGLTDLLLVSESEMSVHTLAAFKVLVSCYIPDRSYTDSHFESLLPNFSIVYDYVDHQMELEDIIYFFTKRKTKFITQMAVALNYDVNGEQVKRKTEDIISSILKGKHDIDPEFSSIK